MKRYAPKLFGVLTVLAVIGSVLMSGVTVLASNWAEANSEADGIWEDADADVGGSNAWAIALANAAGNLNDDDDGTLSGAVTIADTNAVSDSSSYAVAWVYVGGDTEGRGSVSGNADAIAINGSGANVELAGYVDDRDPSDPIADINMTGRATANGYDANADVNIGNSEYGGANIEHDSSGVINFNGTATANGQYSNANVEIFNANIEYHSSGTIDIVGNATATGYRAIAEVDMNGAVIDDYSFGTISIISNAIATGNWATALADFDTSGAEVVIYEHSFGSINVLNNATAIGEGAFAETFLCEGAEIGNFSSGVINVATIATSVGDSNAEVDLDDIGIWDGSHGTINIAATATATGDSSLASSGDNESIEIDDGSTANINAIMTATADNGGHAYSEIGIEFDNQLAGNITVYSVAEAYGNGSFADSSAYLGEIPAGGFYFDIDADSRALAFAVMLSDGTNAFAIIYTQANAGGGAVAWIDGTTAFADVGVHPV